MIPERFSESIDACHACAIACEHCADACLSEEHVSALIDCIRLDRDCAEVCRLAAAMISRESDWSAELCRLCAELCDACADECDMHDMDHCRACSEACRACAEACRRMLDGERVPSFDAAARADAE